MSNGEPHGWLGQLTRLPPLSGAVVLALTATPWMQKITETEPVGIQRTYTLWGLLATVNNRFLFLLILAIGVLLAFVVVGIAVRPDLMLARSIVGWLAVAAAVGIVLNTDNGYTPGAGAILTLVVCTVTAGVTSLAPLFRSRPQPSGQGSSSA